MTVKQEGSAHAVWTGRRVKLPNLNLAPKGVRCRALASSAREGPDEAGNVRPCSSFLCHLLREKEFECRR
jgi:hypothetical protein